MLHQIKAQQFYTDIGLSSTVLSPKKIVEFNDFSNLFLILSAFPVLFEADLIFKDFSRKPSKFKYSSSLWEPCAFFKHFGADILLRLTLNSRKSSLCVNQLLIHGSTLSLEVLVFPYTNNTFILIKVNG